MNVDDWIYLGCVCAGLVGLCLSVWWWRGRSERARWWARDPIYGHGAIAVAPGVSLVLMSLGFVALLTESQLVWVQNVGWAFGYLGVIGVLIGVWGMLITLLSLIWWPIHRLWGPRWYVRMSGEEAFAYMSGDLTVSALRQLSLGHVDERRPAWTGKLVKTFWANLMLDAEYPDRRRVARGAVHIFEHGVWFEPSGSHDDLRRNMEKEITWSHMRGARVVADNANARGEAVPGLLRRSLLTRLVVETAAGALLFEVPAWKASAVATCLIVEQQKVDAR